MRLNKKAREILKDMEFCRDCGTRLQYLVNGHICQTGCPKCDKHDWKY